MKFKLDSETYHAEAIERQVVTRFLAAVQGVFNGVFAMSQDIPGLVETSSNLASIKVRDHKVIVTSSSAQFHSVSSQKMWQTAFSPCLNWLVRV